jgi:hypothetical protein
MNEHSWNKTQKILSLLETLVEKIVPLKNEEKRKQLISYVWRLITSQFFQSGISLDELSALELLKSQGK